MNIKENKSCKARGLFLGGDKRKIVGKANKASLAINFADNTNSKVFARSREPLIIQPFSRLMKHKKTTYLNLWFNLGRFVVEISGFEPLASSLRTRRSTN